MPGVQTVNGHMTARSTAGYVPVATGKTVAVADIEKPPLGLMPRQLWNDQRMEDIQSACFRYFEAGKSIPIDWIKEYNDLTRKPDTTEEMGQ